MNVVIVESPAKAKSINKYLGPGFKVLASYGHVRDLPSKDGSVKPDDDFAMTWAVDGKSGKRLSEIASAVKNADRLILATDPDREGEAISWHVLEILRNRHALKDKPVERVVFNAITRDAILDAMKHPRAIDAALVDAYLARRALDYLVGFTLSPVLWRKLPGARSAGRVQSVALRLVCDRENEIEIFKPREYWSVAVTLEPPNGGRFVARVVGANGEKLGRLDIPDEENLQEDVLPRTHSESATEQPAKGSVHSVTDDIDAILGPWRDPLATVEPITKQDCVAAAGILPALPNSRMPRLMRPKPLILDPRHAS